MKTAYKKLFPSAFELWCVVAVSAAILVAGNAKVLLQKLGLISSSSVVSQHVSSTVGNSLVTFDSYSITPGLVTFITWSIIGLVTFSIAQAFVRASGMIKFEREVSSNQYVHPQNFKRDSYWKNIATDTVVSFVSLSLLAVGFTMDVLYVLPTSFTDIQRFLLDPSTTNAASLAVGIVAVLASTTVVYLLFKVVAWRHRLQH